MIEVGSLPTGWASIKLGDAGWWTGGGTPSKGTPSFWSGGTIPWVSPKDMKSFRIRETVDYITEEAVRGSATKRLRLGAVLVVVRSGILQHTLPVGIADVDVTINQDLKGVELHEFIQPEFFAYYLRANQDGILHTCSKDGTTVQNIDFQRFERVLVPIPPHAEQRRIVAEIEKQFSRLDAAVTALKRVQANLKRYRASVLQAACEGCLAPSRDGASADISSDSANALPSLPHEWRWVSMRELIADGPQNGLYLPQSSYGTGHPILRIDDYQNGWSRSSGELRRVSAQPGDIVRYNPSCYPRRL